MSAAHRNRARRGSGEPRDVASALAALEVRPIEQLRAEWRDLHQAAPPRRLSRDLMVRAIAYGLQERLHGGLAPAICRRLKALAEEIESKGAADFERDVILK